MSRGSVCGPLAQVEGPRSLLSLSEGAFFYVEWGERKMWSTPSGSSGEDCAREEQGVSRFCSLTTSFGGLGTSFHFHWVGDSGSLGSVPNLHSGKTFEPSQCSAS